VFSTCISTQPPSVKCAGRNVSPKKKGGLATIRRRHCHASFGEQLQGMAIYCVLKKVLIESDGSSNEAEAEDDQFGGLLEIQFCSLHCVVSSTMFLL
jgi:hypothetical protein